MTFLSTFLNIEINDFIQKIRKRQGFYSTLDAFEILL